MEARNKLTTQHYPQWTTIFQWNRMVLTDNNVMQMEMRFLLILESNKKSNAGL